MTKLADLPAPPPGRTGWPWTEESVPLPPAQPDGTPWPRVSIVTPSFNQAQFLEETIRSVLLQGYPNLEYWVMDGGSRDDSATIIERYAPWLAGWLSEPDRGQSSAINKGFARATGEWFGWLNSDDCYAPDALANLLRCAQGSTFVAGESIRFFDGEAQVARRLIPSAQAFDPAVLRYTQGFDQPACLWRRELFEQAGPLEEDLHYTFDWQFFARCAPLMQAALCPETVVCYRIHATHKSGSGGTRRWEEVTQTYATRLTGDDLRAFRRVRPWLGFIRRVNRLRRRYGRFGLYYVWWTVLTVVRWLVLDRSPRLNPYIIQLLELPYPSPTGINTLITGPVCDGTVAGALRAFQPER